MGSGSNGSSSGMWQPWHVLLPFGVFGSTVDSLGLGTVPLVVLYLSYCYTHTYTMPVCHLPLLFCLPAAHLCHLCPHLAAAFPYTFLYLPCLCHTCLPFSCHLTHTPACHPTPSFYLPYHTHLALPPLRLPFLYLLHTPLSCLHLGMPFTTSASVSYLLPTYLPACAS